MSVLTRSIGGGMNLRKPHFVVARSQLAVFTFRSENVHLGYLCRDLHYKRTSSVCLSITDWKRVYQVMKLKFLLSFGDLKIWESISLEETFICLSEERSKCDWSFAISTTMPANGRHALCDDEFSISNRDRINFSLWDFLRVCKFDFWLWIWQWEWVRIGSRRVLVRAFLFSSQGMKHAPDRDSWMWIGCLLTPDHEGDVWMNLRSFRGFVFLLSKWLTEALNTTGFATFAF